MAAVKIANFVEPEEFKQRMDEWIRLIRSTQKVKDVERIWLPGEKEIVTRQERLMDGIPLNTEMVEELRELAAKSNVEFGL